MILPEFSKVATTERHTRVVQAVVSDAPELLSRSGLAPMRPVRIKVYYDCRAPERTYVAVWGHRTDVGPRPAYRPGVWPPQFERKIRAEDMATAPEWVAAFVAEHQPDGC